MVIVLVSDFRNLHNRQSNVKLDSRLHGHLGDLTGGHGLLLDLFLDLFLDLLRAGLPGSRGRRRRRRGPQFSLLLVVRLELVPPLVALLDSRVVVQLVLGAPLVELGVVDDQVLELVRDGLDLGVAEEALAPLREGGPVKQPGEQVPPRGVDGDE